jgi:hypothetical protein
MTNGVVSPAFRLAGIPTRYHHEWMKDDPEYKKTIDFVMDGATDFVESKMFERINGVLTTDEDDIFDLEKLTEDIPDDIDINTPEGEKWLMERRNKLGMNKIKIYRKAPSEALIAFYLRTKGRKRGYTERTEITGADGTSLLSGKTDEELMEMIKNISAKLD